MKVGVAFSGSEPEVGVIAGDKIIFSTFSFFGKAGAHVEKELEKWERNRELDGGAAKLLERALGGEDVFDWSRLSGMQQRVLKELRHIEGVVTYGELARRCGTGARAVGAVMRSNPFAYFVPCHRVVARNGEGGFSTGLDEKRAMLQKEARGARHL